MIRLGLLGFGHVGRGLFELVHDLSFNLKERTGHEIVISQIGVRHAHRYQHQELKGAVLQEDLQALVSSPDVDMVVEVMGGEQPACALIQSALRHGKPVVTANKEVISKHLPSFLASAAQQGVSISYEAAVCGAIPILNALRFEMSANPILAFCGILNGTTNFILSKIFHEQKPFELALKEAQALGFAEADPKMDVSGLDAAYKVQILSAVAFHQLPLLSEVYYEGIEHVSVKDMYYAKELGYTIKLLGMGKRYENGAIALKVHPTFVPLDHMLASISNELNAIFVSGHASGDLLLSGKGAGSLATASAVLSDICDVLLHPSLKRQDISCQPTMTSILQTRSQFYIRISVADHARVLEKITGILGHFDISIANILQKESHSQEAEIVLITHHVIEQQMQDALVQLKALPEVHQVSSFIRVGVHID